jgi:hypothetical protein
VVIVGACWYCSPAAEAVESVIVELTLDINPSELQGNVSKVDRERGRCHYMQKNQSVLDMQSRELTKKFPSGSSGSLYAHPLPSVPLSTKWGRQSIEGYARDGDLSVDRCARHELDGNMTQDIRFI